jgi:multiple sugar transport system substrate-binding protein
MSRERFTGPQMSRRNMLAALGLGDIAAASIPVLGACGLCGRTSAPNGASEVTGGFD